MSPSDVRAEYEALRQGAGIVDVSSRGKIEAAGTEAAVFLHNLSTNDVKGLRPGTGCETFWCTATAKVIGHGFLWRGMDEGKCQMLWLDVPASLRHKLYLHLDRYLISEDVTLTDQSDRWAQWHLAGPNAPKVLTSAALPAGEWAALTWQEIDGIKVRCVEALGIPGYDLLCPVADSASLSQRLSSAGACLVGDEAAEIVRLETGTPRFGIDIDENTFAPEVNRTAKAISYTKGCYLGQEPIVMARDRGVVQRLLVGLTFDDGPVPLGSILHRNDKEVGRVTSSLVSPARGAIGLGYVRRGSQAPGTRLEVETPDGRRPAEVAVLPFV